MKMKIEIGLDNDAFQSTGDSGRWEVARILRGLAERIRVYGIHGATEVALRDYNGNAVGKVELVRDRKAVAK